MKKLLLILICALAFAPLSARAQTVSPASQALSQCIASATSTEDNIVVTRWMFVAMAQHPSVASLSNVSEAQRADANRQMGALFNRLVLESCAAESRTALLNGGPSAFEAPFSAFGERAMENLMGHPNVNAAIQELGSYLDIQRLAALLGDNGGGK